jgi:hypothetical protein
MFGSVILKLLPFFGVAFVAFATGWTTNGWRLNAKIDNMVATQAKEIADAQHKARQIEQDLQAKADGLRKDADNRIRSLTASRDSLLNELRSRSERPSASSITPDARLGLTAKGCSGAELYREDSEFLVREAARADTLREGYRQCVTQYNEVRRQFNQ